MRILVTGGAGFIGSHVAQGYLAAGHDVAILDNLSLDGGGRLANIPAGARFYSVDITDARALNKVFERERPEVVSHQAAQHSVKISTDDPLHDARVNVLGLLNVLEACRQTSVRKILFASSGATYGSPEHMPMNEETPQIPESPYGITKMAAEHYLRYYREAYGLDYTVFRYGNIYGPRQDPNGEAGVIAIFAYRLLSGQQIRMDWDGEQARDYVYVGDIAQAGICALERGGGGIYCLGTGAATSVNEILRRLTALVGHESPIVRAPKRPGDVRIVQFDSARARAELLWEPIVPLDEGLAQTVAYFRDAISQNASASAARA